MFAEQLERRLEKVHVQTKILIKVCQRPPCNWPGMARVPDEASDHSAILLLDPCLIVLSIRSRPGEDNLLLIAERDNRFVNERTVIV